jgi:hypothetical protein
LEASKQPGSDLHPKKLELVAGRASSLTTVPTGKNALQEPAPLPPVMTQSMPAGCEVTRPLPLFPGMIAMLPFEKWKGSHTVITACLSMPKSPPTVPMIVADCALVNALVETVKAVLVDPAGTVTLGGTVAAAVLSLVRSIVTPPDGAAELRVTVPVAGSSPTTFVGLMVSEESVAEDAGGGDELTVQPDRRAVAADGHVFPHSAVHAGDCGDRDGERTVLTRNACAWCCLAYCVYRRCPPKRKQTRNDHEGS